MNPKNSETPKSLGYRMPAEWEKQDAIWLSWPHNEITWPGKMLASAENSYIEIIKALHKGQKINLLVNEEKTEKYIMKRFEEKGIDISQVVFLKIKNIDAWIRDYGPTFVINDSQKKLAMVKWKFNAWGDKYDYLKLDGKIPYEINKILNLKIFEPNIVLEGGSIEVNGTGTLITTEQCLLNRNRNPNLAKDEIEHHLKEYLDVYNILWLKEGIEGDDTDGHIDDITRFVNKNTVVCAFEENEADKNHQILKKNYELLKEMKNEDGEKLSVIKLPMPGHAEYDGKRYPASYTNFYVGNEAVIAPVFGHENDRKALQVLQKLFPSRKVVGINCREMVYGFGTIHCASQQEPKVLGFS